MPVHTDEYARMVNRAALRRRALLRDLSGKLIYPPRGKIWTPSAREQAACDSFIVLFVAELETYIEEVIARAFQHYLEGHRASFFSNCSAGKGFYSAVKQKSEDWARNNNTNWSRIGPTLEFVGISKSQCATDLWDNIETIAQSRGGIVHNSLGVRTVNDPRIDFESIKVILNRLRDFDRDIALWLSRMEAEVLRMKDDRISFMPGLGTISTS